MTLPILPLLIGGAAYGRARQMKSQQAEKEQQAMTALARQLRSAGLYEDPAAQAAVGQMMNPALREVGMESALAMLAPGAAQQREMSALQLENQRQANAGQRVAQQQAAGRYGMDAEAYQYGVSQRPAEERRSALAERAAQVSLATGELGLAQARLEAAKPQPVLPYGTPPKGYFPVQAPGGDIEYIPQPGTQPFQQAEEAVRTQENLMRDLHLFQTSVEKAGASGTELFGELANTLRFQRGNVLSGLAKLRNLGVLQPGEYEILEQQLPDPTSVTRNILGAAALFDFTGISSDAAREAIQAPYTAYRKLVEDRLRQSYKTYWYIPATPGALPETAGR